MARPQAPHGTYSAYRRHKREGSDPCPACIEARIQYNRSRSTSITALSRRIEAEKVAALAAEAPATPLTGEFKDRRNALLQALRTIDEAVPLIRDSQPSRLYLLLRERRETVRELAELETSGTVETGGSLADELQRVRDARAARVAAAEGAESA